MPNPRFINVSLPREIGEIIDSFLGRYGYRSRADFVVDAIRRRAEELKRIEKSQMEVTVDAH